MSLAGMGSEEKLSAKNNNNNYKNIREVPAARFIASFEAKARESGGNGRSVPRFLVPGVLSHAFGRQLAISQMDSASRHFDIGSPGRVGLDEFWERLQKFLTEKGDDASSARSKPPSAENSSRSQPIGARHASMPGLVRGEIIRDDIIGIYTYTTKL